MKATDSDAFRVGADEGRVVLEFGRLVVPGAATADGVRVAVTDRVLLTPVAAERLLWTLRQALLRPRVDRQALGAGGDALAGPSGLGAAPVNLPSDPAAAAAARLLDLVTGLGVPRLHERSFRMSQGSLQSHRFLLSMNVSDLGVGACDRALDVARALGMPDAAAGEARAQFGTAHCVHFGFEAAAPSILCKLYLERLVPAPEAEAAAANGQAVLLHQAWKWDTEGVAVRTRYDWFPGLDEAGIAQRLSRLFQSAGALVQAGAVREVLALAASRAPSLQYLEVHEDGGRHSFDLNLYPAELHLRDITPHLLRLRDVYGIRPGQFQALLDQVRPRVLGHLAGGVHRDGRDFINVYYGAAAVPAFASKLG